MDDNLKGIRRLVTPRGIAALVSDISRDAKNGGAR